MQISIKGDPGTYRFPVPAEFNRQRSFTIKAADLPVAVPYGADAAIAIIETDRRGEKVIAQAPLRYRTI
jgi:hypothetical protein